MDKPQILLLTHGGWGMSLVKGVRMILGAVDFVDEVPLLPEMTLPEYLGKVKAQVEKLPEGSLILTDVFGGTTTNVGAKLGKDFNIKVYSGLNAPMLLEACSSPFNFFVHLPLPSSMAGAWSRPLLWKL